MTNLPPIKEARMNAGLTQKALSEWLGIPKRTIEDWDAGKSKPSSWVEALVVEKIERDAHTLKNEE